LARAARILARALGRGGSRPSVAAVLDSLRRGAHVLRHSRVVPRRARGGVFDLDLHVAVVADVRTQLEERGVPLTEWSVSGHTWAFGRTREPVAVVNEKTWFAFGPARARRFRRAYGSYLRSFDGFLATYPPAFGLLYEGFGKPTLAIAATRYEWPFTHNAELWRWLDDGLRRGVEDGWLTLAANNRADADYLRHYAGLEATVLPSACAYAAGEYTGRERAVVVCTPSDALAGAVCDALQAEAIPLRGGLGARYTRADLYARRALVFIPYNVSIMALFEHYSACAPIYVPGPELLKALMAEHPADVLSSVSFCQVTGRAPARAGDGLDLNDLGDERVVDWYLERADFYDREWMPHVRRFDSWEHLDELLAADDQAGISEEMRAAQPERLARIAALWDDLGWTGRVVHSAAARG
jgi:hypothetical protein